LRLKQHPEIVHEAPYSWIFSEEFKAPERILKLFEELAEEVDRLEEESKEGASERVRELKDVQTVLLDAFHVVS
jgi:hypothetical protein